jgi:hypothetical protein
LMAALYYCLNFGLIVESYGCEVCHIDVAMVTS